jgi:hypothetical protein
MTEGLMAAGQFSIDPVGLRLSGAQISSSAQQLQGHLSAFQQELAGYGQPWGSDMVGSLIGMCYGVISGIAMQSVTSNIAGLDDHAQRVQAMSTLYGQAESTDVAGVNRVREMLG